MWGMRLEETLMCNCCPKNPNAVHVTLNLVNIELEDVDISDCELCKCLVTFHLLAKAVDGHPFSKVFSASKSQAFLPCEVVHS